MASASSEAGSTRSQEIEELERFIDSYVLEYQVQGILGEKTDGELDNGSKAPQVRAPPQQGAPPLRARMQPEQLLLTFSAQWTDDFNNKKDGSWTSSRGRGSIRPVGLSGCLNADSSVWGQEYQWPPCWSCWGGGVFPVTAGGP